MDDNSNKFKFELLSCIKIYQYSPTYYNIQTNKLLLVTS